MLMLKILFFMTASTIWRMYANSAGPQSAVARSSIGRTISSAGRFVAWAAVALFLLSLAWAMAERGPAFFIPFMLFFPAVIASICLLAGGLSEAKSDPAQMSQYLQSIADAHIAEMERKSSDKRK